MLYIDNMQQLQLDYIIYYVYVFYTLKIYIIESHKTFLQSSLTRIKKN